ncbi:unnamed protein product [Choristocarpus tenellus]
MLEEAFGAGKGKHAGKERRRHTNKYKSDSKASDLDPWEMQLRQSKEAEAKKNREEEIDIEMVKERKERRKQERGEIVFPSEEEIDPYDPSTFGFIEVGLCSHVYSGWNLCPMDISPFTLDCNWWDTPPSISRA